MENLTQTSTSWSIFQKLGLRFALIFTVLFIFLLDWISNAFSLAVFYFGYLEKILDPLIFWVGDKFFGIDYPILTPTPGNHSDSTYVYILYFTMIVLAVFGAIIWSLIDRKRKNLDTLYYWQRVIVRYFLAINLFVFALEKFFKTQFGDLGFYQLSEPLGDMTPMSLAWAFFGYSYSYNIFMGIAESAALLLLFRRTTTLGALLTAAAMANVAAVNISYDIHAKIYASMMFIMAVFLLLPNLKQLYQFFLTDKSVSLPVQKAPVFNKRWKNITLKVFKGVVIVSHLIYYLNYYWSYHQRRQNSTPSELYGIYDVQSFVVNQDTLSIDHPLRWNQLIIEGGNTTVRLQGDSLAFAFSDFDQKRLLVYEDRVRLMLQVQELYRERGSYEKIDSILIERQAGMALYYTLNDSINVNFKGEFKNDSLFISAKRSPIEIKDFRLMRSKINKVTEVPLMY